MATEQERNRGAGAYSTPGVDTPASKGALFETATVTPFLPLKTTNVDPPATLYVTEQDVLTLLVWNSFAGLTITLTYRMLRAVDGQIVVGLTQFIPTTNRVGQTFAVSLPSGFLLDIQVGHPGLGPRRGQTFCVLALQRNLTSTAFGTATLLADYLTESATLGWPGARQVGSVESAGFLRSQTVTTPAAGADWTITVPTNARWKLIAGRAVLTTSAVVANRVPGLVLDDGVTPYFTGQPNQVVPASQVVSVSYSQSSVSAGANVPGVMTLVPPGFWAPAGHRFSSSTGGIQVADTYTAIQLLVEEWIET